MARPLPARNPRLRRTSMKYVIQVCLLLAICFWLIYQVKHSHDKRRKLDIANSKILDLERHDNSILKLGRKDLPKSTDVHKDEEEEEDGNDADENVKTEGKSGETVDHGEGGNVVGMNEHGHEKLEGGLYDEEEFLNEEREREEREGEVESSNVGQKNAHEAREEHYKGDDASSAVALDSVREVVYENSSQRIEHSERNVKKLQVEDINGGSANRSDLNSKTPSSLNSELHLYNSTDRADRLALSPALSPWNGGEVLNTALREAIFVEGKHDGDSPSSDFLSHEFVNASYTDFHGHPSTSESSSNVEKEDLALVLSHSGEVNALNKGQDMFGSSSFRNETETGESPITDSELSVSENGAGVQKDPIDSLDDLLLEHRTDGNVDLETISELQSKVLYDDNAV